MLNVPRFLNLFDICTLICAKYGNRNQRSKPQKSLAIVPEKDESPVKLAYIAIGLTLCLNCFIMQKII